MSQDRYYEALYDPETGGMTLKPKWRLNAPGYARTTMYSGSLVTGASELAKASAKADRERAVKTERQRERRHALCGSWMRYAKEACARAKGHAGDHLTRETLDHKAVARRAA